MSSSSAHPGSLLSIVLNAGKRCIKKFKKLGAWKNSEPSPSSSSSKNNSLPYKKIHCYLTTNEFRRSRRMKNHRKSSASASSSISYVSYLEDSRRASAITRPSVQTIATYLDEVYTFQNSYNEIIDEQISNKSFHSSNSSIHETKPSTMIPPFSPNI